MILQKLEGIQIYGDTNYRDKTCPKESAEAVTFVSLVRRDHPKSYGKLITHIRNEGKRRKWQVEQEKAEGLTPGAPDFMIPCTPPFLCELKRQDHSICKISDAQIEYLHTAQGMGAWVCVALGYKAALEAFNDWRGEIYLI